MAIKKATETPATVLHNMRRPWMIRYDEYM
jgi:hypothetical protein